ncbi:MAG TPA: flagellar M-ring protein FliF C-terminal domain-containing protein [Elusimicrobiales bacterium]|nr:flagellar M-ring protein FliF C-terminal domain-containing protein [Elusimicrobiales bacterium]
MLAFSLIPVAVGAGSNLEEKTKYEKVMEQKVEEMLASLLGPGKAKVIVQASIDFSSTENMSSAETAITIPSAAPSSAAAGQDSPWWQGMMDELTRKTADSGETRNIKKDIVFPQFMVKRLTVSVLLSETLPETDAQKMRAVVSNMLGMDPKRGDEIFIIKAKFAPPWYTPEMVSLLFKYGAIAIVLIIAMSILSVGFFKMASAMSSMAGTGEQKISMEMNPGAAEPDTVPDIRPLPLGLPHLAAGAAAENTAGTADGERDCIFSVAPDKLSVLVGILAKDEPADIALILVHLPLQLRNRFLSMFPPEKAAEIVASVANVRFVDPEMITSIREALEKRLNGAIGGYEKALEIISNAGMSEKKSILENLQKNHPEIAERVRPNIIFLEDIEKISERDMVILAGALSVEKWMLAAWKMTGAAKAKLKAQLTARSWQMIEQSMQYERPAEEKINMAVEEVVAVTLKLIAESRITNPHPGALTGLPAYIAAHEKPLPAAPAKVANDVLIVTKDNGFY